MDFQEICYLAWDDPGTHRKYVLLEQDDKLKSIKGTFSNDTIRGICAICNRHSDVGLFTTSVKGQTVGTFTNYSNYICADSQTCNRHVTDIEKQKHFSSASLNKEAFSIAGRLLLIILSLITKLILIHFYNRRCNDNKTEH